MQRLQAARLARCRPASSTARYGGVWRQAVRDHTLRRDVETFGRRAVVAYTTTGPKTRAARLHHQRALCRR